jgi:pimeloyl-ACP methyl ester carboxylesterase
MTPRIRSPIERRKALHAAGLHGQLIYPNLVPISLIVCIHGGGCNGQYFDLPEFSFADVAINAGHAVLVVDRPAHGASPCIAAESSIRKAADLLPLVVAKAWDVMSFGELPVTLFGHSIGGAVAMHCAAQSPELASCLVTSGIGTRPSDLVMDWHRSLSDDNVLLPSEFFFGPEGSFDWRAPIAIRKCAEPWRRSDIDEILLNWPNEFKAISNRIVAPVLSIFSEHERIWEIDEAALETMCRSFAGSIAAVEIAAGGGHLYEVHRNWSEHAARIVMFIEENIK